MGVFGICFIATVVLIQNSYIPNFEPVYDILIDTTAILYGLCLNNTKKYSALSTEEESNLHVFRVAIFFHQNSSSVGKLCARTISFFV